tara:strand:- start:69 stop:455 length:387 start_codon:yes stop_codon:yes gene_type:complete
MKKITLFLIALLTLGCSDPNDKYIALECGETLISIWVLNKETKTYEKYLKVKGGLDSMNPSQPYTEDDDNHYLLSEEFLGPGYYRIDRRTLKLYYQDPLSNNAYSFGSQCKVISVPKNYLARKSQNLI